MSAHIRQSIEKAEAAREAKPLPVMPRINAYRGASPDDCECTARAVEAVMLEAVTVARALIWNLNENLRGAKAPTSWIDAVVELTAEGAAATAGTANDVIDLREFDR